MNALISGSAGRALLLDGDAWSSFEADDPSKLAPRRPTDFAYLFGEMQDLRALENTDIESVHQELKNDSDFAVALELALILLDAELPVEIRREAIEGLDELLADAGTVQRLENILYARPLPQDADLAGALKLYPQSPQATALDVLQKLQERQSLIADVSDAWDLIPTKIFSEDRTEFQRVAAREGLFRSLVLNRENQGSVNSFLMTALLNSSLHAMRNYRQVLQKWVEAFRQESRTPAMRPEVDELMLAESTKTRRGRRRSIDRAAVLQNVESQKAMIVSAMRNNELWRVRKILDELVNYQLENGEPIHAAKSLCDLAAEAKLLGIYSLQLELAEQSTRVKPDDAWSWRQYADALLSAGRPTEALTAYERADAFGGGDVAKNGRAQTLKVLGRLDDALAAYDEIIADYPENVVHKNGRADTLKALGRLNDALAAYDANVADYPEDVVSRSGRAETLKALGRLNDSLTAYDELIADYPDSVVSKRGRADTLKALGRLSEALAAYDEVIADYPESVVSRSGRADVLKALGRLNDALAAYDALIADYPESVVSRSGRADTLKALGRLNDALAAYNALIADYPQDVVSRNGRSCVLAGLQRYDEALEDLPNTPKTANEWIGFHLRGMIMLQMGDIDEAIRIFKQGVANDPIPLSRQYFHTALSVALMRHGEYESAKKTLSHVEAKELQPHVNVLLMHCYGEEDQTAEASKAFESISAKSWAISEQLIEELHRRYILKQPPLRSDDWVFDQEIASILVVANQQTQTSSYVS